MRVILTDAVLAPGTGFLRGRRGDGWGSVFHFFMVGVLVLAGFVLSGCGDASRDGASYDHVYTVRARVVQVPDGTPGGEFLARHEAIPDYQAANGSVGMRSMVMPFQIVDPAVLEGVSVGDIVEVTYGETHRPRVSQGVISIRPLPDDTELELGEESH